MKEELEIIRKACIEANPEIMELKFGCEVHVKGLVHTIFAFEESEGLYSAILNKPFPEEMKWADYLDCEFTKDAEGVEILGRPVRLVDVLLAADFKSNSLEGLKITSVLNLREDTPNQALIAVGSIVNTWNLRKDSLSEQSPETITFLANLLKK